MSSCELSDFLMDTHFPARRLKVTAMNSTQCSLFSFILPFLLLEAGSPFSAQAGLQLVVTPSLCSPRWPDLTREPNSQRPACLSLLCVLPHARPLQEAHCGSCAGIQASYTALPSGNHPRRVLSSLSVSNYTSDRKLGGTRGHSVTQLQGS